MKKSKRASLVLAFLSLQACAGDDQKPPSSETAEQRSLAAIREVFETRARGDGSTVEDASVLRLTRDGIEWRPKKGEGDGPSPALRLVWDEVDDVDFQVEQEKPAGPEIVYLYLARGARSIATSGAVRPPLSGIEVVRCYVALRDRPRGSRHKLVNALDTLRRLRPRPVRASPPPEAAPVTGTGPSALEVKLRALKDLHEKGLIDDDVYKEAQRKALAGE